MKKEMLIFDFDGTIADTLSVAVTILNSVGGEFGIPKVSPEEFMHLKHKKVPELMEMAGISWLQLPMFIKRVREEFRAYLPSVQPIPGMPEVVRQLHGQGYRMGILTSNTQENVACFLKKFEIDCFEFIVAPGSIFGKSGALKEILKKQKIKAHQALMLGDEVRDIKAAQKCKVDMMAVSWGFNATELLYQSKPQYLVDSPAEILHHFNSELVYS
jgi:phosphoglycolate phosphatase